MHDDIKTVLLTKEEIDARVQEMGKQIAADYAGKELVVIVLLKGAAWFATDLTRAIETSWLLLPMVTEPAPAAV